MPSPYLHCESPVSFYSFNEYTKEFKENGENSCLSFFLLCFLFIYLLILALRVFCSTMMKYWRWHVAKQSAQRHIAFMPNKACDQQLRNHICVVSSRFLLFLVSLWPFITTNTYLDLSRFAFSNEVLVGFSIVLDRLPVSQSTPLPL